jgi:superfamily II DNA/RNA helicase
MSITFAQLGVPDSIVGALAHRGITEPFEIQAATLVDALAGRDVCGRAPTGSGKTLAFGIPLIVGFERAQPKRPRALVLAPTRELAEQIHTELATFSGPARIGVVYGGVGYGPQLNSLRRGVDVLVACPGRLEDLIEQGALSLADVGQVVLDEADRMADMGFMPAVRRLLDQTADDRQTLLFSATLDGDVATLTKQYQRNPVRHEVGRETPDITEATHVFWKVAKPDRVEATAQAISAVRPAIVFCRTRHGSDKLAKQLERIGVKAAAIHGGRSQSQRTRALQSFSRGRVQVMVATDVAARGIHVDGVAAVIHYDPPEDHKTYVHRSGRTARAGKSGVVISLLQPEQVSEAKRLQRQLGLNEPFARPEIEGLRALAPSPVDPPPQKPTGERPAERSSTGERRDSSEPRKKARRKARKNNTHANQRPNGDRSSETASPKSEQGVTGVTGVTGVSGESGENARARRRARRAHLQTSTTE